MIRPEVVSVFFSLSHSKGADKIVRRARIFPDGHTGIDLPFFHCVK